MTHPTMEEIPAAHNDSDQDFDPSAEMLVDDFDDERTLEEEEAMERTDSVTNELDDLQREGEMPLSKVLETYGYENNIEYEDSVQEVPVQDNEASLLDTPEPTMETGGHLSFPSIQTHSVHPSRSDLREAEVQRVMEELGYNKFRSRPLLRSVHNQQSESSDTGSDSDYYADDDLRKKKTKVGSEFQAAIPEGLSKYDDAPAYQNEDRLLWNPTKLSDEEVEDYLRLVRHIKMKNAAAAGASPQALPTSPNNAVPTGRHIRDDEQALFLLLQCGYSKDEALRRCDMHLPPDDAMSLWSEEECRGFEHGIKAYGKDFHSIQVNKVRTRAVSELVQFFYLWKKTERHDNFVGKNRIEKKKYALHPGTTDYMDRFLDEQESLLNLRDRSSSPSSHVPMFGDLKKRSTLTTPETNTGSSTSDLSVHEFDSIDGPSSTSTSSNGTGLNQENSLRKSHPGIPSAARRMLTIKELAQGQQKKII